MALSDFAGTWEMKKSEKFSELLSEMGVGMIKRKMAESLTPTHKIEVAGDKITITTITTVKTRSETFELGQEQDIDFQDEKAKATVTFEDGKLKISVNPASKKKVPDACRYIEDGKLILELTCGNVKCIRTFERK